MTDIRKDKELQSKMEEWLDTWETDVYFHYKQLVRSGMPKQRVIRDLALSQPKQINPKHLRFYLDLVDHNRTMNAIENMSPDV